LTPGEIAVKVKTRPNVIGAWIKKENWSGQLSGEPVQETEKPKKVKTVKAKVQKEEIVTRKGVIRQQEKFDEALKMFKESGGKISNSALARNVGVNVNTISKWRKMPEWSVGTSQQETLPVPAKKETAIVPMPVGNSGIYDALVRVDGILDDQIRESINLKAEVHVLMQMVRGS
jgi:uncharacterized protein YjcR